ncbi:MAG: hypothetical protein P8R37_04965 [Opitutae bacterium]|nr:hypothetical protein [Opitutae bacterium]MDG1300918.1 hypothetical protein [Opitutae bacterium]
MPSNDPHLEDDLLVSREKILEMFDPPPGRSTFFEWVNKGLVVKARGLTGYYLLNATRKKVKLPLVDVKRYRAEQHTSGDRSRQLVYTALVMLVSELNEVITEVDLPDTFTPAEYARVKDLIADYEQPLAGLSDSVERLKFCRGVLDAQRMSE